MKEHPWEAHAVFNWCPVRDGKVIHAVYRGMSFPELLGQEKMSISTIGHTTSTDGEHYEHRRQLIVPEHGWEQFGCEDPRVTKLDDKYYIFYTALGTFPFSPEGIRVAVATTKDFQKIEEKHLVTPFNAKAMALFPRKINGKIFTVFTLHPDLPPAKIAFAEFEKEEDMWSQEYWEKWHEEFDSNTIDPKRGDKDHVEVGAPPIETDDGWLLIYSYIQDYFEKRPIFGVEALLLDKENPREVIGSTSGAFLVPESLYEKHGNVPNIVFPSGALVSGDKLEIFYGSADTTCCLATVDLDNLIQSINPTKHAKRVERFKENPIITPKEENDWESKATFNPAAIDLDGRVHILYRAMSSDNTSTIGYASSGDGFHIDERLDEPIYVPREDFETKAAPGNSGCEDPRIIEVDDRLYMFYTAFDAVNAPRVAVSSIKTEDFLAKKWEWTKPSVITPPGIMDKDTALLPEKIDGKYMLLHRISDVICIDMLDNLDFETEKVTKCIQLFKPRPGMWDSNKVGIAAPPIKTEEGWLLLYHGVSKSTTYRVGAVLLDPANPTTVLSRTTAPILQPTEAYEKEGQMHNVVFPCGVIERDGLLYIYYGGADSVVGVATIKTSTLLNILAS